MTAAVLVVLPVALVVLTASTVAVVAPCVAPVTFHMRFAPRVIVIRVERRARELGAGVAVPAGRRRRGAAVCAAVTAAVTAG
jgi:hypothetical protein